MLHMHTCTPALWPGLLEHVYLCNGVSTHKELNDRHEYITIHNKKIHDERLID